MFAEAITHLFGGGYPDKEAADRDKMRDDLPPVPADGRDTEEDDVAAHRVGKDMAVVEKDDGIQQSTGSGQEQRIRERIGLVRGLGGRHLESVVDHRVSWQLLEII